MPAPVSTPTVAHSPIHQLGVTGCLIPQRQIEFVRLLMQSRHLPIQHRALPLQAQDRLFATRFALRHNTSRSALVPFGDTTPLYLSTLVPAESLRESASRDARQLSGENLWLRK